MESIFFALENSREIANEICKELGTKLADFETSRFADGEIIVDVRNSVRNKNVFLVGSLCKPVNENVMEMLIFLDALKRASAREITIVITYYAYARQDRKENGRKPITASLLADLLKTAGASRVITIDLHNPSIQGFFDLPIDDLKGQYIFAQHFDQKGAKFTIVSPDHGGATRARTMAELISDSIQIAIVDKRRVGANKTEVYGILGDVKGKNCLIIDDIIDTGGTIIQAAEKLKQEGAKSVYVAASHGLFSKEFKRFDESSAIDKVAVLDTIPKVREIKSPKLEVVSVAPFISKIIWAAMGNKSITSVYKNVKNPETSK